MGRPADVRQLFGIVWRSVRGRRGDTSVAEHPYECVSCDGTFSLQYHICPECGSFSVESRPETVRASLSVAAAD
jgi:rRNA maturation endonuclease Nob1